MPTNPVPDIAIIPYTNGIALASPVLGTYSFAVTLDCFDSGSGSGSDSESESGSESRFGVDSGVGVGS